MISGYRTFRGYKSSTNSVRVRFAPSPTGYLHLGGLRTALYNFLFARAHKGAFILRIEDTDQSRLVDGATGELQTDFQWAGIEIDEGPKCGGEFGPYVQSQRVHFYRAHMEVLLAKHEAYYCFCSDNRLELLRKDAVRRRQVPKYDNRCRYLQPRDVEARLQNGDHHCVRFKLKPGLESFDDLIYGTITYDVTANEGDPVIVKSDGFPTYHFANVVDDHLMHISHVLRGTEWQISTTKHVMMYKAFGWQPPVYGHLPLLLNADGTKLSKRQGDIKIAHYRENGVFPLALCNYIVNSGGGFEKDLERGVKPKVFTMPELARQFDVRKLNSHPGKLMPERLQEFNRLEIERRLSIPQETDELVERVRVLVQNTFGPIANVQLDPIYVRNILTWSVNRIDKLEDLTSKHLAFIWVAPQETAIVDEKQVRVIEKFGESLRTQTEVSRDGLGAFLRQFAEENGVKFSTFMKTLRAVLSGLKEGPGVAEMIEILGKENTLGRIETFVNNKQQ